MANEWQPGESGNPAGRPALRPHLTTIIRDRTQDGVELVDKALRIFRESEDAEIVHKYLTWLADRGWGRPWQSIELAGKDGEALSFTQVTFNLVDKSWQKNGNGNGTERKAISDQQ